MPAPSTREQPYTHAKMMIIDGTQLFLGSINFSENSTRHARELAIIVSDHAVISAVTTAFEADWRFAAPPPPPKTENVCPRNPQDQSALPIAW
jgi:phosphatidylserine/phosphatidylglycerophosphate/cardiolipin synthase-like enzyme